MECVEQLLSHSRLIYGNTPPALCHRNFQTNCRCWCHRGTPIYYQTQTIKVYFFVLLRTSNRLGFKPMEATHTYTLTYEARLRTQCDKRVIYSAWIPVACSVRKSKSIKRNICIQSAETHTIGNAEYTFHTFCTGVFSFSVLLLQVLWPNQNAKMFISFVRWGRQRMRLVMAKAFVCLNEMRIKWGCRLVLASTGNRRTSSYRLHGADPSHRHM